MSSQREYLDCEELERGWDCLYNLTLPPLSPQISQRRMGVRNQSTVTEFLFTGLTDQPELQLPVFCLFLGIYMVTAMGNLSMILVIRLSSQLHKPMYYFLSSLSFIDFCYSSVITPRMLAGFLCSDKVTSYSGCMTQLFSFCIFIISECYMLAAMAYDRYVAICSPCSTTSACPPGSVLCWSLLSSQ